MAGAAGWGEALRTLSRSAGMRRRCSTIGPSPRPSPPRVQREREGTEMQNELGAWVCISVVGRGVMGFAAGEGEALGSGGWGANGFDLWGRGE